MTTHPWRLLGPLLLALAVGCGGEETPSGGQAGTTASGSATTSSTAPEPTAPVTTPPDVTPPSDLLPVPDPITPDADGGRFAMAVGATTDLVVRDAGATDPQVTGTSVILIPVANVTDSGVRTWEVRAVEPGTSTVTSRSPAYDLAITVR